MNQMQADWQVKQDQMRKDMPMFARGAGVWEGIYRHLNENGELIDQHTSRLITRFSEEGPYPYLQTNIYTWDDGRKERRHFPVDYVNGKLAYDNELIKGYFTEISDDEQNQTILGYWRRKGMDGIFFYELIHRSACGKFRTRTWQWIKDEGGVFRRTIIDEKKVSDNWKDYAHELEGL